MGFNIYSKKGILKVTIEPDDNSTHTWALMSDNMLKLSFTLFEYVPLAINDYIDFEGERFKLTNTYRPEKKSTIEYDYNVSFYGLESLLKNALNLLLEDNLNEGTFSLTDTARVHAQLIVDNINRINGTKDWVLGEVVGSGNKTITYDNLSCFDSAGKVAEVFKTEWWIEGTTFNLSRCEHGEPIELGYLKGLLNISKSSNDKADFFTVLYPVGSSRNIDKKKYGHSRLCLPNGVKYVENNIDLGVVERSEESAFSHIYPRRVGVVSSYRTEDRKNEEGTPYTVYFFSDSSLNFNLNDYNLPGLVKNIEFQSGELAGYNFEINYNDTTNEFEIITQFPDEVGQLPNKLLAPERGSEYVVWNMSMPDEYYPLAEKEFEDAVIEHIKLYSIDTNIYKAPSDYIYFDENKIDLRLGRRVKLLSEEYFEGGERYSRVTSISRKLIRPTQMDIDCSHAVEIGRADKIESNIVDIQTSFKEYLNQDHLQVLKSWDSSDPTEYNVLSAIRSLRTLSNTLKRYLRKDIPDEAAELITFLKGIDVKDRAVFESSLSSEDFVSGFPAGSGWAVLLKEIESTTTDKIKKSSLEIDEITVRGAMRIYEFIISQLSGENGTRLTTDMMRVHSIDTDTCIIYLDTEKGALYNPFKTGDVIEVQQYGGVDGHTATKSYEFIIVDSGIGLGDDDRLDWIKYINFVGDILQVTERDVLTRVDSLTDTERKGLIKHTSVEPGSPYIDVIYGMKTNADNATRARLGRLSGIFNHWWGQLKGFGLYADNAYLRGDFQLRTGDDVRTMFEIIEGMLRSSIQSITYNLTENENYLTNATFTRDMEGWEHESDIELYSDGDFLLDIGYNFLSHKNNIAEIVKYDGRQMLRLNNSYIRQKDSLIRKPEVNSVMHLTLRYKTISVGQLRIGFENGVEGSDFIIKDKLLSPHTEYKTIEIAGIWNGVGDFYLGFTGDIYIEQLSFSNKPLDDYKQEVSSLFEQTEKSIKAVATEVDNVNKTIKEAGWITSADGNKLWATTKSVDLLGNKITNHQGEFHVTSESISGMVERLNTIDGTINTAGWITTAEGNKLWASKTLEDGNAIISYINQTATTITISAKKIKLEGAITANGNVFIEPDGTLTAIGGRFNGYISFPFKNRRDSDAINTSNGWKLNNDLNIISLQMGEKIVLPVNEKYNGCLVNIFNASLPPYSKTGLGCTTTITIEGGGSFCETMDVDTVGLDYVAPKSIKFIGCLHQFLCVVSDMGYYKMIKWILINKIKK